MRGRVRSALAAAPVAFALLLTGCAAADGGGSGVASVTGARTGAGATPSADPQDKGIKYAQCMREHGIDMPDPEPGKGVTMRIGPGTPKEKVEQAEQECKQWAPAGRAEGGGDPKRAEALRKVAQCMRDNGVEKYPDPDGGMMRITRDVGEDPDFKSAQEKCQKEMGEAGMGGLG
ncbi:hypothetical protein Nocox_34240 [Nonomuraea coxensis DSM 45129]|uniref:Lipoprotein n=1 Tax=Nonomuraea coxensis DSM 45129 TaxID=1122611 RepID=A0ABX8UCG7_9ACTN|nr:hypothetical protein [Nonomuraea coxensis]QYC44414.1 hypothetical protein Nocox_34240 [Nonomuraea coxensis DSM 45129]